MTTPDLETAYSVGFQDGVEGNAHDPSQVDPEAEPDPDPRPVRFWHAEEEEREDATEIGPGEWVDVALIEYAEADSDGQCEGRYLDERTNTPNYQPFIVEYSDGSQETWEVSGELAVDYHASKKEEPKEDGKD